MGIDDAKRNVSWIRTWCDGVIICHMTLGNSFKLEAPRDVVLYSRPFKGNLCLPCRCVAICVTMTYEPQAHK
jgi:hypothetical protein